MRRVLIFVLLGIIAYSSFSSIIPAWPEPENSILIDAVYGVVPAGNFTYWNFGQSRQKGPLMIELTSLVGDADLFVADHPRPSFEADRNNFSSETCGRDVVTIPADFPRPIVIAVFGHWAHGRSEYWVKVFAEPPRLAAGAPAAQSLAGDDRLRSAFRDKDSQRAGLTARREEERPRVFQLVRMLDTMVGLFV